jgi:membrane protease subunit (stomatin/prohibitin family)
MGLFAKLFGGDTAGAGAARSFAGVRWGTVAPVVARLGGEVVQLRAFGTLSCAVADPALFAGAFAGLAGDELTAAVTARIRQALGPPVTDAVGAACQGCGSFEALRTAAPAVQATIRSAAAPLLAALGLDVTGLELERLEPIP